MTRCESCVFWAAAPRTDSQTGFCHRYPPRDGVFEMTPHTYWCGEGRNPNADEDRLKREWAQG
jgi:hypothetical protein